MDLFVKVEYYDKNELKVVKENWILICYGKVLMRKTLTLNALNGCNEWFENYGSFNKWLKIVD